MLVLLLALVVLVLVLLLVVVMLLLLLFWRRWIMTIGQRLVVVAVSVAMTINCF